MDFLKLKIGNKILTLVKFSFMIIISIIVFFGYYYQKKEFEQKIDETLVYQADKVILTTNLLNEIAIGFAQMLSSDEQVQRVLRSSTYLNDSLNRYKQLKKRINKWVYNQKKHSELVPEYQIFDAAGNDLFGTSTIKNTLFNINFISENNNQNFQSGILISDNKVFCSGIAQVNDRRGKHIGSVLVYFDLNTLTQVSKMNDNFSFAVYSKSNNDTIQNNTYTQREVSSKNFNRGFELELSDIENTSLSDDQNKYLLNKIEVINSNIDGIFVFQIDATLMLEKINRIRFLLLIVIVLLLGISFAIVFFVVQRIVAKPVQQVATVLENLAHGKVSKQIPVKSKDEIGQMRTALNKLNITFAKMTDFAKQIGESNLDAQFTPQSKDDILGKALLEMRHSLLQAKNEEKRRSEEDSRRNWTAAGLAKFAEIMRKKYDSTDEFSNVIIQNLINYINVSIGAMYITDMNKEFLMLSASQAYDNIDQRKRAIEIGEGLIGACAQDGETIFIKEIPNHYMKISSGLGETKPKRLLIVALKQNEEVYGILEFASFHEIEQYKIDFVEQLAVSITVPLKMMYLF